MNHRPAKKHPLFQGISSLLVCALLALPVPSVEAFQFSLGDEVSGNLDTTLSYGAAWRMKDQDSDLIGTANRQYNSGKGDAYSVNYDDGNLNYDKGDLINHTAKITSELALNWRNFGLFVRGTAFYDFENNDGSRQRTELSSDAKDMIGKDATLLDAYINWDFDIATAPAQLRVGQQVLSWGESTFIQNGINIINPFDVSKLRVAGAELREGLVPVGMVSGSISPTENISFEGFYQYEWEEVKIDPPGSYWSTNDFAGEGGNKVMLGWGDVSDLGTTNPQFPAITGGVLALTGGTINLDLDTFEPDFLAVSRMRDNKPKDDGQYGLAMRVFAPGLNDSEFGFYFINYHSRLPLISAWTGSAVSAAQANALAPATAPGQALEGAIPILINHYAQTANYLLEYPEDIKLYGASFNTLINATGTALQGEYSYRKEVPLQIDDIEVLIAALTPLNHANFADYNINQVGIFGTDTYIRGYKRLDVSQAQMTATHLFGPTLGSSQFTLVGEVGLTHVHGMPSKSTLRFDGPGTPVSGNPYHEGSDPTASAHANKDAEPSSAFADATSWGYRMVAKLDFNNAIGAVTLSPRIAWAHDVQGTTPGPGGNFVEGRKAVTLGLGANYQNKWAGDISYTEYFGAGRYNLINDRDFLAAEIKYFF